MTAARVTRGAISLSSSSHFPPRPYSNEVKPVALRPGRAKLSTNPAPTGSAMPTNTIGIVWVACSSGATPALESASVWRERNHFDRVFLHGGARAVAPAIVQTNILPNAPAQLLQRLDEGRHPILSFRIVRGGRGGGVGGGRGSARAGAPAPPAATPRRRR